MEFVKGAPMNKKPRKIHELIGRVLSKDLKKGYGHQENCPTSELKGGQKCTQENCYYGKLYYRLNVLLENNPKDRIYVYPDYLEKEQIWQDILESNYIDQRYLFYCIKGWKTGNFILNHWKILKSKEVAHE